MLASAIIVTLTGVMFTSPFLLDEENFRVRQFVTYAVIVIVVVTIIYWLLFFIREICIAREQKKARAKMHWASLRYGKDHRNLLKMLGRENELDDPDFNPRKKGLDGIDYDALLAQLAHHVDSNTHAIDKEKMSNLTGLAEMDPDMDILNHHDDDHDVSAEHEGHHNALASLLDNSDEPGSQHNNALASLLDDGEIEESKAVPNNVIPAAENSSLFVPAPPVKMAQTTAAQDNASDNSASATKKQDGSKEMTEAEKAAQWM